MLIDIKIKRLSSEFKMPVKGTKNSAAYDLTATTVTSVDYEHPNLVKVYLGFSTEIPEGYKAVIVPRSSFTHKGWVMQNSPAQIDSDYRGEWMLKFEAIPVEAVQVDKKEIELFYEKFPYKVGDRVAQFYLEKEIPFSITQSSELSTTERGEGGFGSTGKN